MSFKHPLNDLEHSRQQLDGILSSRRLIFNPYTVSDQRLLQIVEHAGWGGRYDLVEAVVMTFTRLRPVKGPREFDGIFVKVGLDDNEAFIHASTFIYGTTADDCRHRERSTIGKLKISNEKHVESLVGKRVFVSRIIHGRNLRENYCPAYRMTRLSGNEKRDAAAIRQAMCHAKIEMLRRILDYPDCDRYLNCAPDFFDYKSRILRAISIIESYSRTTIPED